MHHDDDDACLVLAVLIHALGKFSCCESIHQHEFEIKIVPNAIKGLTYELPFSSFKSFLLEGFARVGFKARLKEFMIQSNNYSCYICYKYHENNHP